MQLNIKDKFNQALPADADTSNTRRQVLQACFSYVTPRVPSAPSLIHVSTEMAAALGLKEEDWTSEAFLKVFSGASVLENTQPYAMCYGGHQFGHWAGQLGDGRAINLAEVEHNGQSWTLQLKGAGETPYSRRADGLAVLRSSIREHLCSEAMHHLGVPTTRSLSLMLSGDQVLRDMLYDGNAAYEKGAIVCRVAPSFIRFGNFQIFTSRGDVDTLRTLTDFTIRQFFPQVQAGTKAGYIDFFKAVVDRTLEMIVHWQRVGFVHGVMNTDNMSILGLTIDYGPYGWLEGYDPDWTPNTTDREGRRYRFGYQPRIALWNLIQLANALVPLIEETEPLQAILDGYSRRFEQAYLKMMHQKLGLEQTSILSKDLVSQLEAVLELSETDMTIFFRKLADFSKDTQLDEEGKFMAFIQEAFYQPATIKGQVLNRWENWFRNYQEALQEETQTDAQRKAAMHQVNPKYVLRNYMAQLAIDAADQGDYSLVEELYELLKQPYAEQPGQEKWFAKRPEWARHKVGCSMLSCSS
jgi:uncharacterized protein YdiU (UPF0061 family)